MGSVYRYIYGLWYGLYRYEGPGRSYSPSPLPPSPRGVYIPLGTIVATHMRGYNARARFPLAPIPLGEC